MVGWRHFTPQRVMEMHSWYVLLMATHGVIIILSSVVAGGMAIEQSHVLNRAKVRGILTIGQNVFFSASLVYLARKCLSGCVVCCLPFIVLYPSHTKTGSNHGHFG